MIRHTLIFVVMGCGACTNMDRVAPMSWTYYLNSHTSEAQIRVALLECGYNVPGDPREFYQPDGNGFLLPSVPFNEMLLVTECMKNAGFVNSEFGDACSKWKYFPACQKNAKIPKRGADNRLASPYCQLNPKANICKLDYDPGTPETAITPGLKSLTTVPSKDPTTKLQEEINKIGNTQINKMLEGSSPRK